MCGGVGKLKNVTAAKPVVPNSCAADIVGLGDDIAKCVRSTQNVETPCSRGLRSGNPVLNCLGELHEIREIFGEAQAGDGTECFRFEPMSRSWQKFSEDFIFGLLPCGGWGVQLCHKGENRENINIISQCRESEAAAHCAPVGGSLNVFGNRFEVGVVISARSQNKSQVFSFGGNVNILPNGVETLELLRPSCQISGMQRDINSFWQVELESRDESILVENLYE